MAKPPSSEILPDAARTNWVDRSAPEWLKPWLKLGRFDRPIGIWLLMLPGWQGIVLAGVMAGDLKDSWPRYLGLLAAFALGAALMRAAGCAWNDILDRDIDAKVARTASRPIPAGRISVGQALGFVAACCLLSLVILVHFNLTAVALGAGSLVLVALYPLMKRVTWWPQAWLGLTFNWGALLGFAAASAGAPLAPALFHGESLGALAALPLAPLLLYTSGLFWTLGYDTIYALQDVEDDALAGVKSTARRLGSRAPAGVLLFYVAATILALATWAAAGLGPLFFPPFVIFAAHLSNQVRRLRLDDPSLALALFKSNREAGLLLFVALAAGFWR
ncbi:MAG: 4-hydroxybenzoate octaprenyltransferase [Caulobacteraceae bacterium]|nr:4-hydroxybenzoate octaprenyltransferase [Caulobacteraceae bacterium]